MASYAQLKALWIDNGGNPAVADIAAAIAMAESGGVANASNTNSNGSIDRGYWQINSVHGSLSTFDPVANVKAAIQISNNGKDWNPWVTYTSGAYKKFMSPTTAADSAGNPTASTAGISIPGLGGISVSGVTSGIINTVLGMLGIKGGLKDMAERFGLIILGFALVLLGIHLLSGGSTGGGSNVTVNEPNTEEGTSSKSSSRSGDEVKTTSKKAVKGVGADEAVEAAAVALWDLTSIPSVPGSSLLESIWALITQVRARFTRWVPERS